VPNEAEERELSHFVSCEAQYCARCSAYLADSQRRSRRAVNLIFATIWVAIGTSGVVAIVFRIIGR
jgi:hypothetical protein